MNEQNNRLGLLKRGFRRYLLVAYGVFSLVLAVAFSGFLLSNYGLEYLNSKWLGALPDQELLVGLKKKDVSIFRVAEPGSKTLLTRADLDAMAGLDGVRTVFPIVYGTEPTDVEVNLLGTGFQSGMVIQGFEPQWIAGDIDPALLEWQDNKPIPIVVNTQVLAIYNNAYAKTKELPELSVQALKTPIVTMFYGAPPKKPEDPGVIKVTGQVVGLSPRVALGAAIPRQALEMLHHRLAIDPPPIVEAVLTLTKDADSDRVKKEITAMGFHIVAPNPINKVLLHLTRFTKWAGWSFLVGLVLLATFAFFQSLKMSLLLLRNEISHCANLQITKGSLRMLLLKDCVLGLFLAIAVGLAVGFLATTWLNQAVLSDLLLGSGGSLPSLSFPWSTGVLTGAALLAVNMVLAIPPINRAARAQNLLGSAASQSP